MQKEENRTGPRIRSQFGMRVRFFARRCSLTLFNSIHGFLAAETCSSCSYFITKCNVFSMRCVLIVFNLCQFDFKWRMGFILAHSITHNVLFVCVFVCVYLLCSSSVIRAAVVVVYRDLILRVLSGTAFCVFIRGK